MKKQGNFTSGESVRIAQYDKIKETLDTDNCLEGLLFMENMARFCGNEFEILQKVNWIYDESTQRMLKCKDIYVLRGVLCDGKGMLGEANCDRCCTLMWKGAWLEKAKTQAHKLYVNN